MLSPLLSSTLTILALSGTITPTRAHDETHFDAKASDSKTSLKITGDNTLEPSTLLPLVTFDKSSDETYKFVLENDPVMGGQSHSDYEINDDVFKWNGDVVDVPKLQAPGFCSVKSVYLIGRENVMNDASQFTHLKLRVRSSTEDYTGFKVSFSSLYTKNHTFKSFKANFMVHGSCSDCDWKWVDIPFEDFSNDWSPYTGDAVTKCKDDPQVCPMPKDLSTIKQITLWAEGLSGHFNLDVLGIYAGFSEEVPEISYFHPEMTTTTTTTCTGPIQENLRFNISSFTADEVLPYFPEDESLAYAVCCDPDFAGYAEPRGFYSDIDVSFFDDLSPSLPNTFYDPVCGIPLFVAPVGRTFEEFYDETVEHGWPSFREEEMVEGNVRLADDGRIVLSACGTRLGTLEPDEKGARYCLDVSCISGSFVNNRGGGVWEFMKRVYFRSPRVSFSWSDFLLQFLG